METSSSGPSAAGPSRAGISTATALGGGAAAGAVAVRDGDEHHAPAPTSGHPVVAYNPDAPSEEWGWHGSWRVFAPRGSTILLILGVVLLFLLNFTEHVSHVENYYFNGFALAGALWIVWRIRSGRAMRRRQQGAHPGQHSAR